MSKHNHERPKVGPESPENTNLRDAIAQANALLESIDDAACNNEDFPYKRGREKYYKTLRGSLYADLRMNEYALEKRDPRFLDMLRQEIITVLSRMGHPPARKRMQIVEESMRSHTPPTLAQLVMLTTASAMEDKNINAVPGTMANPEGILGAEEGLVEMVVESLDKKLEDILPLIDTVETPEGPQTLRKGEERKQTSYASDLYFAVQGDLPRSPAMEQEGKEIDKAYAEHLADLSKKDRSSPEGNE